MRAVRALAGAAAGAALLGAGLAAGLLFHSPTERVAVPVPEQVLTARVERTSLSQELTGQGVFTSPASLPLAVTAPAGMDAVVTSTPYAAGQATTWCTVLVEVSGRPVILLPGDVPAYRDLTVGDVGADVRRLQEALRACGQRVAADGVFGERTAAALTSLYRGLGYRAVTAAGDALGGALASATPSGAAADPATSGAAPVARTVTAGGGEAPAPDTTSDPASGAAPAADPGSGVTPTTPPAVVAPRGELHFMTAAPRLLSVAGLGQRASGTPVATLATTGDEFSLTLTAAQRALVEAGMPVALSTGTWSAQVSLPAPPTSPTVDESGTPGYPVSLPLPGGAPEGAYGQHGDFIISVSSATTYDAVVPVAAVYEDTASQRYVLTPAQPQARRVDVDVLAAVGGQVAVRPHGGELGAGDEVVIGVG